MSLTCTNRELLIATGTVEQPAGIVALSKRDITDIKASYAITKAIRKAGEALTGVEKDRLALAEKCGLRPGDPITPEFLEGWNVMLDDTVTLDGVRAVTIAELQGSGATPQELLHAGPFVIEGD